MTGIDGLDKVLDAIDLGHQVGKVRQQQQRQKQIVHLRQSNNTNSSTPLY
jgi:hypothetical protein